MVREIHAGRYPFNNFSTDQPTKPINYDTSRSFPTEHRTEQVHCAESATSEIQKDSMRFRRNMERIGEITAYEFRKAFSYQPQVVETPLGEATVEMIDDQLVIATILRAGFRSTRGF